jgi:hypothetical protein
VEINLSINWRARTQSMSLIELLARLTRLTEKSRGVRRRTTTRPTVRRTLRAGVVESLELRALLAADMVPCPADIRDLLPAAVGLEQSFDEHSFGADSSHFEVADFESAEWERDAATLSVSSAGRSTALPGASVPLPATIAVNDWMPVGPEGSLVYERSFTEDLVALGDFDEFVVQLDAGQTLTVVIEADPSLLITATVSDGVGQLATQTAAAAGQNLLLQNVPIAASGTYTVRTQQDIVGSGDYSLRLLLNAAHETESITGVANNDSSSALDLNASGIALGGGIAGRMAVVGGRGPDLVERFEHPLGSDWVTFSSDAAGQVAVTGVRGTASGDGALIMGRPLGSAFVRNAATWTVDLTGVTAAALQFQHVSFGDEVHTLATPYTTPIPIGDGVSISANGTTWHRIFTPGAMTTGVWQQASVDLVAAATTAGISLGPNFHIRFHQYDNNTFDNSVDPDGRGYDEIQIVTSPAQVLDDWYRFSLQDGETVTLAMHESGNRFGSTLNLYDSSLTLLASGTPADDLAHVIRNYLDQTNNSALNDYYVQIVEPAESYTLVITQDADFDVEHNDAVSTAQRLDPSGRVLGYLSDQALASLQVIQNFPGPDFTGLIPPDPILAVGPQQVVAMVNSRVAIYDKTGNELFSQSIVGQSGFFGNVGATGIAFDPWLVYDQDSDRFFIVAIDIDGVNNKSNLYIAVSTSSTPTDGGDWHKYRFDFTHHPEPLGLGTGAHFPDYEKLSVTDDAVYISGNYFAIGAGSGTYVGITALEKASLLSGAPANFVYQEFFQGFSVFPLQPIEGGTTQYFAELLNSDTVRIHALSDVVTDPNATRQFVDLEIDPVAAPINVPQLGSATPLHAVGNRIMTGVWRDGHAYFAHAIQDPAVPNSENRVRWYQIAVNDLATGGADEGGVDPALVRTGDVVPGPGVHAWMPGLAVDQGGNVAVGFSIGGASMYGGAAFTGFVGTTSLPVVTYAPGQGTYVRTDSLGRNRWGDYTGMVVDSEDDTTFWAMNEYATPSNRWATQIASFQLAPTPDTDVYEFEVTAGDPLVIETFTPFDGASDPFNLLDATLTLIDPNGVEITNDNGPDGRNARIEHGALVSGTYRVVVSAVVQQGPYLLSVQGSTAADPPPTVIATNPDSGRLLNAYPATYRVTFSEPLAPGSVEPADLLVNGFAATAVVVAGNVATFTLDPAGNIGSGTHTVQISANAVADLQGNTLPSPFGSTFVLDLVGPQILATRWNDGQFPVDATFLPGTLSFEADLSEDIFVLGNARRGPLSPASDDVRLRRILDDSVSPPVVQNIDELLVNYSRDTDVFRAEYGMLSEGNYELAVFAGTGAFEDDAGNAMDGEPIGPNPDGTVTGNGFPGGNYGISFTVDIDEVPLQPFERMEPLGGLIARSQANSGYINSSVDVDAFVFTGTTGQVVTTQVLLDLEVFGTVELWTTGGAMLATATSNFPGEAVVLPAISLPSDSMYELRVMADAQTDYEFDVWLNTLVEEYVGDTNELNPLAIDASFAPLGSGRWAVVGTSDKTYGYSKVNDANQFVDISNLPGRLSLTLSDEGEAFVQTLIGNELIPAGVVTVSNNGGVLVGAVNHYFRNLPLPAPMLGRGLFPYWDDLGQTTTGGVYVAQTQIGGVGATVFQWSQMPHSAFLAPPGTPQPPPTDDITFQLQLFGSGNTLAKFVYQDTVFGYEDWDNGNSATIGFQESDFVGWEYNFGDLDNFFFPEFRLPATNPVFDDDVVSLFRAPDVDEYTLDLSGRVGARIDLLLTGLDGIDYSSATLELVDPNGIVVATASDQPLGVSVTNYDRGILNHVVADIGDNLYTVRVASVEVGTYSVVVTDSLQFDTEPNSSASPLRSLDLTPAALGYLDAVDTEDSYLLPATVGQSVVITYSTLFDNPSATPLNSLVPSLSVLDSSNNPVTLTPLGSTGSTSSFGFTADGDTYTITLAADSGLGEYLLTTEVTDDVTPPQIVSVRVAGTAWSESFRKFIDPTMELGYIIPQGPEQADTLPWINVNRIYVEFSEKVVNVNNTTVTLDGLDFFNRDYSSIIVNATEPTSLITLELPTGMFLLPDRLRIMISDAVTDRVGNQLDGEWMNDVQTGPSGDPNGLAGGPFDFRMNVLPGDANESESVLSSDFSFVRSRLAASILLDGSDASENYLPRADLNGDGRILSSEFTAIRNRLASSLPLPGVPAVAAFVGSREMVVDTLRDSDDMLSRDPDTSLAGVFEQAEFSDMEHQG